MKKRGPSSIFVLRTEGRRDARARINQKRTERRLEETEARVQQVEVTLGGHSRRHGQHEKELNKIQRLADSFHEQLRWQARAKRFERQPQLQQILQNQQTMMQMLVKPTM